MRIIEVPIIGSIPLDNEAYTCAPSGNVPVATATLPMPMLEEEAALCRAWDALQAVPSYCEENARSFAQEGK